MGEYTVELADLDRTQVALAGGKGALLGELSRIEGIRVPAGFCVTTEAYERMLPRAPALVDRIERLSGLDPEDRRTIGALSAEVRQFLEAVPIPEDLATAIIRAVALLGGHLACAVRSSATAEDLPGASFAGQQDTYLNVVGAAAILRHVSRCWASLFTDRAVTYRLRHGLGHRDARMAVVVQKMVFPEVAGVLFTADPVTSNRKLASVEAVFGLGEGLVSGRANADVYTVRDDEVVAKTVAEKHVAIEAGAAGGIKTRTIAVDRRCQPALTDAQVVRLAQLGRRLERHFGHPQDIEWCLANGDFEIVQSRPITTLFPVPDAGDQERHVYLSVGHQQMMTDAMKPLGLSLWQLTTPRPMAEAGGRLFVDVTKMLGTPDGRAQLLDGFGRSDPLTGDALRRIVARADIIPPLADDAPAADAAPRAAVSIETDPAIVAELIERTSTSIAAAKREIARRSGPELLDFVLSDLQELRRLLFEPRNMQVIYAAIDATSWLNEQLEEWLGEKNAADTLIQSAPGNVTSEMGLALLDVADVIRPHPEVVAFLEQVADESFLDRLPALAGGREARAAIEAYLERYGMRCAGEIDVTRPRWSEHPSTLVPMILGNVRNFAPGAGARRFEQGLEEARSKERAVLSRLRALPDGERKADEVERMIDRVRTFIGYREYPKYGMVSRYFVYKQALLAESDRLVQSGVLEDREDIFFLRLQELDEVVRTHRVDRDQIGRRRDAFVTYGPLRPPRVFTSDGEVITGSYRREGIPRGALVGLPVSAGTVQGRARVILDMAQADLEPGDILVTAYTDPSWTPVFVSIAGLVTEVGGLMTHGAVIAREYGLPAVVSVDGATRRICDGQQIRVDGTTGYVELLSEGPLFTG